MNIKIRAVDQDAVIIVSHEDGESPRAFTMSEIRGWLATGFSEEPENSHFAKETILDLILERIEFDLIDPG